MNIRERKKQPAVFLDRDGTIIEDRGHLKNLDEVVFINGAIEALSLLNKHYPLFIVSNQEGISKKLITDSDVSIINDYIQNECIKKGVYIQDFYICPHQRLENCKCIKPNPYFLHIASQKYGIKLEDSYVIGDHPHDIELAENAGAKGIYVLTGHGKKHLNEIKNKNTPVLESIRDAVDYILAGNRKNILQE